MTREIVFGSFGCCLKAMDLLQTINERGLWNEPAKSMLINSVEVERERDANGEARWRMRFRVIKKFIRAYAAKSWGMVAAAKEVEE